MSEKNDKELYLSFDEYIRQGEPSQREAAYAWSTAIGLQAVDGLKTSEYLNGLARRNIEGEITIDEVEQTVTMRVKQLVRLTMMTNRRLTKPRRTSSAYYR